MLFEQLNLIEPILKALNTEGYTTPTPIQEQSIPIVLERRDLLGCAQTGTGKTAAFAIPILQILHEEKAAGNTNKGIKALILTPTRELAIQIDESFAAYGKNLNLKHLVIFGGVSQGPQTNALRNGVDILIATPGRLLDLVEQRYINLSQLVNDKGEQNPVVVAQLRRLVKVLRYTPDIADRIIDYVDADTKGEFEARPIRSR